MRLRPRSIAAFASRVIGAARLDELEAPEAAETTHLADRRVLPSESVQRLLEHGPKRGGVLDDALLAECFDRRDPDGAGEGMTAVRQPA
jgi:hypothetical protein